MPETGKTVSLPMKNKSGYYEIRLESIGGLGANLCGKMLGELGIKYLGLNSASFSSYGSEKTGTPVKGYIRYCEQEKEIRVHSPVTHPQLLCVFHDALLKDPSVLEGCGKETIVVINTESGQEKLGICGGDYSDIYLVPAQKIARETRSRINVVMMGAMAKAMGFVELKDMEQICEDTLGRKYPDALTANLEGIRRGFEESCKLDCEKEKGIDRGGQQDRNRATAVSDGKGGNHNDIPQWGYATAPIGGINPHFGNSVISDLSPSRQGYIPLFIQDKCINCGLCDSTCPDMVFQFRKGTYQGKEMMVNVGLDYYHCKGCLRCVQVCPTEALVRGLEAEHPDKKWFLPNQELLRRPEYYEKTGADGYITSESYLTEKQMDGGEV